jgi:hypothetical protein
VSSVVALALLVGGVVLVVAGAELFFALGNTAIAASIEAEEVARVAVPAQQARCSSACTWPM